MTRIEWLTDMVRYLEQRFQDAPDSECEDLAGSFVAEIQALLDDKTASGTV